MTLRSLLTALQRFFHLSSQDTTMADNTKISQLTQQLTAAKAQVAQLAADKATLAGQVSTYAQQASDAVAAQHTAEAQRDAAIAQAQSTETERASLQAQLDAANQKLAALPDADTLAANEAAQQDLVDEVAKAQGSTATAPTASGATAA